MVSRVDPDTWLSTAEFFRASLPADELPGGRGGPDELASYYREAHPPVQTARVPVWLETRRLDQIKGKKTVPKVAGRDTINLWDAEDTQPHDSPQITYGRRPLAPTVDGVVVCKRRRNSIEHRAWATYAEIRALNAIRQYYIDHPNQFRHIPVPRVYTHSLQRPEGSLVYNRLERGFIIMEHIKDSVAHDQAFPSGDRGWTRRQKRRFVRKMALIRLQLLFIRNGLNGVEPPIKHRVRASVIWEIRNWGKKEASLTEEQGVLASVINKKAPKDAASATLWDASFNPPYPDNRAWVDASLSREYAFWQLVLNDPNLHHLVPDPIPAGYDIAGFLGRLQAFRTSLQDPAVHTYRTEPFHVLTHGKFDNNEDPVLMKGKKINCIVDWESSGYLPISENIKDILQQYHGAGLADYSIWPDNGPEPFSKCGFYGWLWDDWIEHMNISMWQLVTTWDQREATAHPNPADRTDYNDRYNWYGRITPNDFRYGDKYADQDIDENDGTAPATRFRLPVPLTRAANVVYTSNEQTAITNNPDMWWWNGPVMHLVDDYVQTHLGFPPTWSWQDPVIEDWASKQTLFNQPFHI